MPHSLAAAPLSEGRTLILGLIAGVTILLGLPLGRLRSPRPGLRQFLNAVAVGILGFLLWDVTSHAWEPIDAALVDLHDHLGGLAPVAGFGLLFFAGAGIGLISLVYYERWLVRAGDENAQDCDVTSRTGVRGWSRARRTSLLIAVGIGLHNFGEGLAIGASAGRGEIGLATVLVVGFALHNATEGFGIVAPLVGELQRPSWRFLGLMGLIGGGPTFLGTAFGQHFTSDAVNIIFLTLAAGSILYVVVQLVGIGLKMADRELLYWGLFIGLTLGFLTDMIVTAGGA